MGTILWFIGLIIAIGGGLRFLFSGSVILGLLGANKLGTAKDDQVIENEKNLKEYKGKLLLGIAGIGIGLLLIFIGGKMEG